MTAPEWFRLLPLLALVSPAAALCPRACRCDDDSLEADCAGADLHLFPISLNPRLKKLSLAGNYLGWLEQNGVSLYLELRELDLTNVGLSQLDPFSFEDLQKLQRLSLAQNQLQQLPEGTLAGLQRLNELDLSGNQLTELPAGLLSYTPMLEELVLNDNRLAHLPADVLAQGVGLRRLRLSGNRLQQFPASALVLLSRLDALDIADNSIHGLHAEQLSNALPAVTDLNLAGNTLSRVDPAAFRGMDVLRRLVLSDTGVQGLDNISLASLTSLEQLFIDGVVITRLTPNLLSTMTKLRLLSAQNCPNFTVIEPDAFAANTELVEIRLAGNRQLTTLPAGAFSSLNHLRRLDLSDTGLTTLPASAVRRWSQLESFKLTGCRFRCDCALSWLAELRIDSGVTCDEPEELRSVPVKGLSSEDDLGCGAEERQRVLILALSISAGVLLIIFVIAAVLAYKSRRRLRRNMKGMAWGDHLTVDRKEDRTKTANVSGKSYAQLGQGGSQIHSSEL